MNAGFVPKINDDGDEDRFFVNFSVSLSMMHDCVSGTGSLSEINVDLYWKVVQNISMEVEFLEKYRNFVTYRLQTQ
jgi:hypothetical protein